MAAIMSQDMTINRATFVYIDDLYINDDIALVVRVKGHFARFGLTCKNPE